MGHVEYEIDHMLSTSSVVFTGAKLAILGCLAVVAAIITIIIIIITTQLIHNHFTTTF